MSAAKWEVSVHATRRIIDRYGVDKNAVVNWVNQRMDRAEFVCTTVDADGSPARMFTEKGTLFYAAPLDNVIKSVYEAEVRATAAVEIRGVIMREIRKKEIAILLAEENALIERTPLERESITLRLSLARTRSEARRNAISTRVYGVEQRIREINDVLIKEKRELTALAQGYASIK